MSLEVGEHIPADGEAAFVRNLHNLNTVGIVLSWAGPLQPGHGHVNCHTRRYISNLFLSSGLYDEDVEAERMLQADASYEYFQHSIFVFVRN